MMRDLIFSSKHIAQGLFFRNSLEEVLEEILGMKGVLEAPDIRGHAFEGIFGCAPSKRKVYILDMGVLIGRRARKICIRYSPKNPVFGRDICRVLSSRTFNFAPIVGKSKTQIWGDKYACEILEWSMGHEGLKLSEMLRDAGFDIAPLTGGIDSIYIKCMRYLKVPDALVFCLETDKANGTYIMQRNTDDIRKISGSRLVFQDEITEALKAGGYNTRRKDCMDVALMEEV